MKSSRKTKRSLSPPLYGNDLLSKNFSGKSSNDEETRSDIDLDKPLLDEGLAKVYPPAPSVTMNAVYLKLHESQIRRDVLGEIHEFHHSRKQLQRTGNVDFFPFLEHFSIRRVSSKSSSTSLCHASFKTEKNLFSSKASSHDLFGIGISPRMETLDRFRSNSKEYVREGHSLSSATYCREASSVDGGEEEFGNDEEDSDDDDGHDDDDADEEECDEECEDDDNDDDDDDCEEKVEVSTLPRTPPATGRTLEIAQGMRRKRSLLNGCPGLQVYPLPRGGVLVQTRIGTIQVGLPPETIKDSMNTGLPIPTIFIIPQNRFHRWRMVSVAEFEFPAFWNFFVLGRCVRLITTKSAEFALRTVFQESLLGPLDLSPEAIADDFAAHVPAHTWPNFTMERLYFGNNAISQLLEFIPLKEVKHQSYLEADVGDGVVVRLEASQGEDSFVILDRQLGLGESPSSVLSKPPPPPASSTSSTLNKRKSRRSLSDVTLFPSDIFREKVVSSTSTRRGSELDITSQRETVLARLPDYVELPNFRSLGRLKDKEPLVFVPPAFGVTFLGTSHGFDKESSTTGFVVWINGMGVIVDPPPNSTPMLELTGITPRQIKHVLVTHCHADHDAGTMQKIMLEEHVTILTTSTICRSFLKKYAAVSGIEAQEISKRFTFRACRVGEWLPLFGGQLRVFYSFHTIPTIGFQVRFGGKSLVYSGDTFFHPEEISRLAEQGTLTKGRAQALLDFPWDADLILHECGVAPIHTPLKYLIELPLDVKSRLYLVHVTASSVANESLQGIRLARDGVEGTLVLDTEIPPLAMAVSMLSWIRDSAPFCSLKSLDAVSFLLSIFTLKEYVLGEHIEVSNELLVIVGVGSARTIMQGDVYFQGDSINHPCTLQVTSIRFSCLVCRTEDIFSLPCREVGDLLKGWQLATARNEFRDLHILGNLTHRERLIFSSMFLSGGIRTLGIGEKLWEAGTFLSQVYIVLSGKLESKYLVLDERQYDAPQQKEALLQHHLLCRLALEEEYPSLWIHLPALYHGKPLRTTVTVVRPVTCYVAPADEVLNFLRASPLLLFKLHSQLEEESKRKQQRNSIGKSDGEEEEGL